MTASNLGIIFGPTLIKPRQANAEVSLSSLVDYPYQALIVELLIRHYQMVFDTTLSPLSSTSPTEVDAHLCLTPQEKEQQLSRHSKSLGDIKEVTSFYAKNEILHTHFIYRAFVHFLLKINDMITLTLCFLLLSDFPLQQSSKVYKRHSSIIPSSHLLAEVQEIMPSLDGSDFEPGQYW